MSKGYDVTVTFRVDGAESLPDALDRIGIWTDKVNGSPQYSAPSTVAGVSVLNVFPIRWNIRSLKDEHRP